MPFPFTFIFNVPGIINPFHSKPNVGPQPQPRRSRLPDLDAHRPLSRKRRWQPSFTEPSRSTTTLASATAYLDTPSHMGSAWSHPTSNPHLPSSVQYDEGELSSDASFSLSSRLWQRTHVLTTRIIYIKVQDKGRAAFPAFRIHIHR